MRIGLGFSASEVGPVGPIPSTGGALFVAVTQNRKKGKKRAISEGSGEAEIGPSGLVFDTKLISLSVGLMNRLAENWDAPILNRAPMRDDEKNGG